MRLAHMQDIPGMSHSDNGLENQTLLNLQAKPSWWYIRQKGAYNGVGGMMEVVDFLADRLGDDAAGTFVSFLHQSLVFSHHDEHTKG